MKVPLLEEVDDEEVAADDEIIPTTLPTQSMKGIPKDERVQILAARYANREALWHPDDAAEPEAEDFDDEEPAPEELEEIVKEEAE